MTAWRRRVKDGYRCERERVSTITHAHENNDYSALLRALKERTVYFDGHWLWTGQLRGKDGAPSVNLRARAVRVRRLVSEAYIGGRLDSRDKIFGTCSQKECINPEHLEIRIFTR